MTVDPYASGVLVPEHHERLVADLDNFARDAGIQPHWIHSPLPPTVSEEVRDYLRNFKRHQAQGTTAGLCFTRKSHVTPDEGLAAIAGCLVRNFVRARVMTLGQVLEASATASLPDLSCLLIPNFFYPATEAGTIATWQVSAILDLLTSRLVQGQQTIIYAHDLNLLDKEYGRALGGLIRQNYSIVGA